MFFAFGAHFACGEELYLERFEGEGDISIVGWNGAYDSGGSSGGVAGGFAWVWHIGVCENLIYTNEFTVDVSSYRLVEFGFELRRHSSYSSTPDVSVAVEVGGSWYVSKKTFSELVTIFQRESLIYDSAKENWDELDVVTAHRGSGAASDLSGDITGFGLYSDNSGLGSNCTAEYDNFKIVGISEFSLRNWADFSLDGAVDFADFAELALAWLSAAPEAEYNDIYDFDDDNDVDTNDLCIFADEWLSGAKYPYVAAETNREQINFNTGWKFYKGDIGGDEAKTPGYDDSSWEDVYVPHNPPLYPPEPDPLRPCWDDPDGYHYEGVSWYRKHFAVDSGYAGRKIFIEFEAINTAADVWINGTHLTTHYGGYLPFSVDITDYVNFGGSENVISVKADNTDDPDTPIGNSGWFNWGGIYRDVWMHVTDKLHITDAIYADKVGGGGVFVTYPFVSSTEAQVRVRADVYNEYGTSSKGCTVKTYVVDDEGLVVGEVSSEVTIPSGEDYEFEQLMVVSEPCLWHPDSPYLYTLYAEVYDGNIGVESYETRIGIRRIDFSKDGGFEINGQVLMFMGANRMQDYPYLGYAMPNMGQRRDALKLKEAGFQFVRTSHYPQDGAFLDGCDELGLMVMAPIPGFQYIGTETFINRSYQNMRDLIRRDRNRPCIIAWELSLNETWWTDPNYTPMATKIGHEEYPGEQCYVAGWKDGGMWDEPALYDIFIATPTAGARDYEGPLPLIISEHGHWEYGGSSSDVHRMDGEEAMLQQAWNHQESLHLNRGVSFLSGDALWCGIDLACYPSGTLDSFRLPKFSYYFWQSQRRPDLIMPGIDSGPMVYIANYWTSSSPTEVKVYSNCEQVKLYLNDVLLGTRSPDTSYPTSNLLHPPFTFKNLTWGSGELKAEGYIGGEVAATHIIRTPGAAESLDIRLDTDGLGVNGEIVFVYVYILDSSGTMVPDASETVSLSVTSGPGIIVSPTEAEAEAGIASFLLRSTTEAGTITLSATAAGLTGDTSSIVSE